LTAVVSAILLYVVGCNATNASTGPDGSRVVTTGTGPIYSGKQLGVEGAPPRRATLTLAGSKHEVDVAVKRTGTDVEFLMMLHGEVFDTERYVNTLDGFQLAAAGGETFDPPLDLLVLPLRVGSSWSWSGIVRSGDEPQRATATVRTLADAPYVGTVSVDAIRVDVKLSIELPPRGDVKPQPIVRELSFWFNERLGLFKRQFGTTSGREPLEK